MDEDYDFMPLGGRKRWAEKHRRDERRQLRKDIFDGVIVLAFLVGLCALAVYFLIKLLKS